MGKQYKSGLDCPVAKGGCMGSCVLCSIRPATDNCCQPRPASPQLAGLQHSQDLRGSANSNSPRQVESSRFGSLDPLCEEIGTLRPSMEKLAAFFAVSGG